MGIRVENCIIRSSCLLEDGLRQGRVVKIEHEAALVLREAQGMAHEALKVPREAVQMAYEAGKIAHEP